MPHQKTYEPKKKSEGTHGKKSLINSINQFTKLKILNTKVKYLPVIHVFKKIKSLAAIRSNQIESQTNPEDAIWKWSNFI